MRHSNRLLLLLIAAFLASCADYAAYQQELASRPVYGMRYTPIVGMPQKYNLEATGELCKAISAGKGYEAFLASSPSVQPQSNQTYKHTCRESLGSVTCKSKPVISASTYANLYNQQKQTLVKNKQMLSTEKEEKNKMQKTIQMMQGQLEKYSKLADEKKNQNKVLEMDLVKLRKDIEAMERSEKKSGQSQKSVEVRLDRALEEIEKYKSLLSAERAKSAEVFGSINPELLTPSVSKIITLLLALLFLSLLTEVAKPIPIAVPSSIIPSKIISSKDLTIIDLSVVTGVLV